MRRVIMILTVFLTTTMLITTNMTMLNAKARTDNAVIFSKGKISEVNEMSKFNTSLTNVKVDYESSKVILTGQLVYKDITMDLNLSGTIYKSVIDYQKDNELVIDCNDTDKFKVLSVLIEGQAKAGFLVNS